MIKKIFFLAALAFFFTSEFASAQEALKPRLSPLEMVTMKYDDTYVKITYSRPHKRGRKIFGNPEIVPYGEVWRTGANEATEMTVTKPITIAGKSLDAGTYSILCIAIYGARRNDGYHV